MEALIAKIKEYLAPLFAILNKLLGIDPLF